MSFPDVLRNVGSVQLLTHLAAEHGMSAQACLQDTGIAPEALADTQTEITADQELRLVRNLVRELGHVPGIGLDAGLRYHLTTYGIWGFALASSPTLRSAAQVAIRYLDLSYAFVRFRLEADGRNLQIVLDDGAIPEDLRQFLVERDFAAWVNFASEMRPGGSRALAVQFRFQRPDYAQRFEKLVGVEPRFGAPTNAVLLDASVLDEAVPQANPQMARILEEQCRQLMNRRQVLSGVAGKVRDRLLRSLAEMPGIEAVAADLHMAPRSLRRRLEEEGTSYRALAEEVRQTLAEELLTTVGMKLQEVAMRLGYSEPASFIHAFKRWKGISPNAYRVQHRDRLAAG